jgi:hypothetical protein
MRRPWLRVLRQSNAGRIPVDLALAAVRPPSAMKVMGIFERQTTAVRQRSGRKGTGTKLAQRFAARIR